jgi:DNA-binding IclR family transcriptional regulator
MGGHVTDTSAAPARAGRAGSRRVQSIEHAIDLLDALAQAPATGIGVTELSRLTGLSKAATHHLLQTMESRGFVLQSPHTATYQLGWALHELGARVSAGVDVARVVRPYLDALARETGESVLLGVRVEGAVLYLDRGDATGGFNMIAAAGVRSPLHSNASGKLLLAFMDEASIREYLEGPLESFTPHTLSDPATIRAQLDVIRRDGYATCWQERELGLCSVAVPIRDHTGRAAAALTVAGPAGRITPAEVDRHVRLLRGAIREVEPQLGADRLPAAGRLDGSVGRPA